MTVYVDPLARRGLVIHGSEVASCHMFTDTLELDELHRIAALIGMPRRAFQDSPRAPHYDLTPARRAAAIAAGAVELGRRASGTVWRERRALLDQAEPGA